MCKNPHSVGDLVESEVFKSRTNGESDIVFFVDESGSISKKDLMDALSRPGHYMTVDVQERGFGHPGIMFKVKAAKPHTRQTEEMFNSETFLLKEVELKKPGWRSRNKGRWGRSRGKGDEHPRLELDMIDLRRRIKNNRLGAGVGVGSGCVGGNGGGPIPHGFNPVSYKGSRKKKRSFYGQAHRKGGRGCQPPRP